MNSKDLAKYIERVYPNLTCLKPPHSLRCQPRGEAGVGCLDEICVWEKVLREIVANPGK